MGGGKGGEGGNFAWVCGLEAPTCPLLLCAAVFEPACKCVVDSKDAVWANLYWDLSTLAHRLARPASFSTPDQVITRLCTLLLATNNSLIFSSVVASFSTTRRLSHSTRPAVSYNRQRTVATVERCQRPGRLSTFIATNRV